MISLVSGPPGNGKTFYAIRKVTQALDEGKVVAGNVELAADWPERLSRRNWAHYLRPVARRRFRREADHRYHFSEDLEELTALRLHGPPHKEGRGVMVLDEAHNWMNARSWSSEDREMIVKFFSQHRKLGWEVYLIAQHPEMIDKQVRVLCEYMIHLRNLKKARWGGIPIFPINLFLAVWCWHSANRVVVKREVFPLSWRKGLYDTMATSHGLISSGAAGDGIWLPSPPGERLGPAAGADGQTPPGAADRPVVVGAPPHGGTGREGRENGSGGLSGEHADESGEPEAWPVSADFERPE